MTNLQILRRALASFRDPNRRLLYFDLYTPDVVFHGYMGISPGLASVKEYYERFWHGFPNAEVEPQEFLEVGDTIVVRYVIQGANTGVFMGRPPTGRMIRLPGISILRFREGQCFERWTATDSLELLKQLGIIGS